MNPSPKVEGSEKDFRFINPEMERLFTSFSRETRNPLQSIWCALSVIQRRVDPGDEPLTQAVRIIKEETGQLHGLVQEYLDFVRSVEGKQIVAVDLNALLILVLTLMQHNHDRSAPPVSVSTSLDSALPPLTADYDEVKKAFLQIIKSSYSGLTEKGGSLAVETRFSPTPVPGSIVVALTVKGAGVKGGNFDHPFPSFNGLPQGGKRAGNGHRPPDYRGTLSGKPQSGAGRRRGPVFIGVLTDKKESTAMNQSIKILHIDPEYQATYFDYRPGSSIKSTLNLQEAINLLKTVDIDLILSEPHNRAILNPSQPDGTTVGIKDSSS